MADDKPEGRVLTGPYQNIFKTMSGGRSDYGNLIVSALTGMSQEELLKSAQRHAGEDAKEFERLTKDIATGGEVSATLLDAEDQFFRDYLRIHAGPSLIAPPIAPERLERLVAENNALEPCISAMVTNISCTGYEIVPREGTEADLSEEQKSQRDRIQQFLDEVAPRKSFKRVRKELRRDLQATGNSYMVLERNALGDLAFIRRAPAKSMRIIKLDEPVSVTVSMTRNDQEVSITTMRAERRFAQKVGTKLVYYKEYGASRDLNRTTGEWAPAGSLAANVRAHEIIHDKDIEDVKSPYGVPRWITQLPSVLGSRMAEEYNLTFFQSGGVPPVIIFVAGGMVSEQVSKALNDYLSGGAKDKQRSVAVEVPSSGNLDNEKPANVQVERFGSQEQDSTFENYDEKCELRIRRSFRLPGIFLGMADSYNFATAHASYVVAEAQVFAPEREEEDERYNMTIMREIDDSGEWLLQSNELSVKDVNLQLKALQMVSTVRGVAVSDFVSELSRVSGVDIDVAEDHQEDVIGVDGTADTGDGNPPPEGTQPPQGADQNAGGPPPANAPDAPEPGVTSTVRNQANLVASRMARRIREFDDLGEDTELDDLLKIEADYDALPPGGQEIVDRMLAPVLFNSTFLTEAAMADVAAGYAKAAFIAARRAQKKEAV